MESLQKSIGMAASIFITLFPLLTVAGAVFGLLGVGRPLLNAVIAGTGFFFGAILFGTWWVVLELKRRNKEKERNNGYKQEREQRKALQREHVQRCKKRLQEQQDKARLRYDEAMAQWKVEILPYKQEATGRREAVPAAKSNLQRAEQQWKDAYDAAICQFEQKKADLLRLKSDFNDVEIQREAELKQMLARAREDQFAEHLSQHLVDVAAISDIGPARKRTLQENGVRTAWDVAEDRILRIPRFGPALTENLMEWRRNVEATFIFKTAKAIPLHEMQVFESKYDDNRKPIQRRLLAGANELRKISQDAEKRLGQLSQQIKACMTQLYRAEADLTVIPKGL